MASTLTLLSVVQFCQTKIRMAPLLGAGGIANQPGLDLCNDTLQRCLSSPYDWKFNKYVMPSFTTIPYQQDYVLSGCQMSITTAQSPPTPVCIVHLNSVQSANGPGLTESGTTVSAIFSDFAPNGTFGLNGPPGSTPVTTGTSIPQIGYLVTITGASQAAYNVTGAVITGLLYSPNGGITGVTFTISAIGLIADGGQGLPNVNWVSSGYLQDYMNTATVKPIYQIEVTSSLQLESIIQPPMKICVQIEQVRNFITTLLVRVWPLPSSQIWNAIMFYQGKPPIKRNVQDTWSPWPDELGYILRSGMSAVALDWYEDPRAPMAEQKWMRDLAAGLDIKDQEARSDAFGPSEPIMRGG
jgi:hypothetical protein